MKTHHSILISTVIGISMYVPVLLASDIQPLHSSSVKSLQLAYVVTGGTVRNYGGTRLRYYPNHVIVADSYDRDVIHNIAGLARELGWDVVYVQLPLEYRDYASTYFVEYGIGVNYFGVNINPDQTLNRFYGHEGYPGWRGNHGQHWNHNHHGDHHGKHHGGHHGKHDGKHDGKHHGKHDGKHDGKHNGNHYGNHHNVGHHGGGHKGGGHQGGGHHGGGHKGGGHHGGGHHGGGHHR